MMMASQKRHFVADEHKYPLLTPVRFMINKKWHYGLVISNSIHEPRKHKPSGKLRGEPKPVYAITGYGPRVHETELERTTDEEYFHHAGHINSKLNPR